MLFCKCEIVKKREKYGRRNEKSTLPPGHCTMGKNVSKMHDILCIPINEPNCL